MKPINDTQLDQLLHQHADQQDAADKAMEQATRNVMKRVKQETRTKKAKQWIQLLTYAFGIPVAVVLYAFCLITYMPELSNVNRQTCIAIPIVFVVLLCSNKLRYFTPNI